MTTGNLRGPGAPYLLVHLTTTEVPAEELGKTRNDMIRYIFQEWLEANAYLPVRELDEDGEVAGSA